jgi:hypothetical protein
VAERRRGKRGVESANFDVVDFVLVAQRDSHAGDKLRLRWRGPRRIVSTLSDFAFEVADLSTGKVSAVHASRLRFYADSALDVSVDLLAHIAHTDQGYEVEALLDLRYDADSTSFQVCVAWSGFDKSDHTWEPLSTLAEDVPQLVERLLSDLPDQALVTAARKSLLS